MTTGTTNNNDDDDELEKEISKMKPKEIRRELESYGISTKTFFEKSELVEALVRARKEGKTPIVDGQVNGDGNGAAFSSTTASTSSSTSTGNRQDRIQKEMDRCKSLKVSDLKKELESYGMSTKSFFEKSEFVRAVAEARVDGATKKKTTSSSGKTSGSPSGSSSTQHREEAKDPSYKDVIVSKFRGNKALLEGPVIDVKAR